MGSGHKVTYAWKDTKAGTTLSREARLSQLVQANQEEAYTCTAQTTTAQGTFSVVLQDPCAPSTASPGKRQHLPKTGLLSVAELSLLWLGQDCSACPLLPRPECRLAAAGSAPNAGALPLHWQFGTEARAGTPAPPLS